MRLPPPLPLLVAAIIRAPANYPVEHTVIFRSHRLSAEGTKPKVKAVPQTLNYTIQNDLKGFPMCFQPLLLFYSISSLWKLRSNAPVIILIQSSSDIGGYFIIFTDNMKVTGQVEWRRRMQLALQQLHSSTLLTRSCFTNFISICP